MYDASLFDRAFASEHMYIVDKRCTSSTYSGHCFLQTIIQTLPSHAICFLATAVPLIVTFVITPELYLTEHRVVGLVWSDVLSRIGGEIVADLNEALESWQATVNTR